VEIIPSEANGLATACIGGGQGIAMIVEVLGN
jgi:acetyl-CoA acetyltransferase